MLKLGSTGAAVKALQKKLGIKADGIFGPKTLAALKAYQKKHGLAVDGIAGPKTLAKLGLSSSGKSTKKSSSSSSANKQRAAEIAAGLGYTLAFFDADPELRRLLNKATNAASGTYTTERFIAELQNTKWFRKHGEAYRKYIALQKSDPATLKQMKSSAYADVLAMARQIGATGMSSKQIQQIADASIMFGYNQNQIRNALLSFVKTNKSGLYQGEAGQAAIRFKQIADDYGVAISAGTLGSFVKGAIRGDVNEGYVQQWAANQAASRYPALAADLKAGRTLREIADPYIQSYAAILEMNPDTIKLTDSTLQKALASKDANGKPAVKTLWQFEQDLRQDARYMKTKQAQDKAMDIGRKILSDFGFTVDG